MSGSDRGDKQERKWRHRGFQSFQEQWQPNGNLSRDCSQTHTWLHNVCLPFRLISTHHDRKDLQQMILDDSDDGYAKWKLKFQRCLQSLKPWSWIQLSWRSFPLKVLWVFTIIYLRMRNERKVTIGIRLNDDGLRLNIRLSLTLRRISSVISKLETHANQNQRAPTR